MQAVIKELQDTLTVMVEIERRQSSTLREHRERIVALEGQAAEHYLRAAKAVERIAALEEETAEHYRRSAKYQERTDQNLAEITDKLNGLIGYVSNWKQPPQQPS